MNVKVNTNPTVAVYDDVVDILSDQLSNIRDPDLVGIQENAAAATETYQQPTVVSAPTTPFQLDFGQEEVAIPYPDVGPRGAPQVQALQTPAAVTATTQVQPGAAPEALPDAREFGLMSDWQERNKFVVGDSPAVTQQKQEAIMPMSVVLDDINALKDEADNLYPTTNNATSYDNSEGPAVTFDKMANNVAESMDRLDKSGNALEARVAKDEFIAANPGTSARPVSPSTYYSGDTWNHMERIGLAERDSNGELVADPVGVKTFLLTAAQRAPSSTFQHAPTQRRIVMEEKFAASQDSARARKVDVDTFSDIYNPSDINVNVGDESVGDIVPGSYDALLGQYISNRVGQPEEQSQVYTNELLNTIPEPVRKKIVGTILGSAERVGVLDKAYPIQFTGAHPPAVYMFSKDAFRTFMGLSRHINNLRESMTLYPSRSPGDHGAPAAQGQANYKKNTTAPKISTNQKKALSKLKGSSSLSALSSFVDDINITQQAADIYGKTPYFFSTNILNSAGAVLSGISGEVHPTFLFSTSPESAIIGADSQTFLTSIPSKLAIYKSWLSRPDIKDKVKKLSTAEKLQLFEEYHAHLLHYTSDIKNVAELEAKVAELQQLRQQGNSEPYRFFMKDRIQPAVDKQQDKVRLNLEDLQAAFGFGKSPFFLLWRTVYTSKRLIPASFYLDPHRNKVIRSLIENPKPYLVRAIDFGDWISNPETKRKAPEIFPNPNNKQQDIQRIYLNITARALDGLKLVKTGEKIDTGKIKLNADAQLALLQALKATTGNTANGTGPTTSELYQLAFIANKLLNGTNDLAAVGAQSLLETQGLNLATFSQFNAQSTQELAISPEEFNHLKVAIGLVDGEVDAQGGVAVTGPSSKVENVFFRLRALSELGKMLSSEPGTESQYRVNSAIDGISNGLSIQSAITGDEMGSYHTGISPTRVGEPDSGNILPDDKDIRGILFDILLKNPDAALNAVITSSVLEEFYDGGNPDHKQKTKEILDFIQEEADARKALTKSPTMILPYSATAEASASSGIDNFVEQLSAQPELYKLISSYTQDSNYTFYEDLKDILKIGLIQTLPQQLASSMAVENASGISLLTGKPFSVRLATGQISMFGVNSPVRHDSLNIQGGADGTPKIVVSNYGTEYDVLAASQYSDFSDPVGTKAAKQMTVSEIHNLDAGVNQLGAVRIYNALSKRTNGTPESFYDVSSKDALRDPSYWMLHIHDGFIGDIGSYETMYKELNETFYDVVFDDAADPATVTSAGYAAQLRELNVQLKDMPDKIKIGPSDNKNLFGAFGEFHKMTSSIAKKAYFSPEFAKAFFPETPLRKAMYHAYAKDTGRFFIATSKKDQTYMNAGAMVDERDRVAFTKHRTASIMQQMVNSGFPVVKLVNNWEAFKDPEKGFTDAHLTLEVSKASLIIAMNLWLVGRGLKPVTWETGGLKVDVLNEVAKGNKTRRHELMKKTSRTNTFQYSGV